jgi:hypothetical protein
VVSPWLYQSSNIYYNLGGVGVGTGISSVRNGITLDISGSVRQQWGACLYVVNPCDWKTLWCGSKWFLRRYGQSPF